MKSRWVVGGGAHLEQVFSAWKLARPDENVMRVEVPQGADYSFDLTVLDGISPAEGAMFVAFDERFGNFKRMELMQAAMERGFKLESFVAPSAIVPPDAVVGPNVFIGEGVVLGIGCRIEFNAFVRDGARLGTGVHLRSSCWLETGVLVGDGVDIGAHSILRMGAIVGPNVKVGKHCELGWAQLYDRDVPSKTVFDARYEEPIRVYGE
jgi:UDP-3-O-[3-hydroxymyristoyl] glucosamine N-acyltransferase